MPNRSRNESRGPYKILHETNWSKGQKDLEVRTRLVVIAFTKKLGYGDYALRWQNYDGATWGGSAFDSEREAHNAFMEKYLTHNKSYKEGNVSHLPGIKR
jgi:hypothetical protein